MKTKGVEIYSPKILEKRTEHIGILRRITHVKIEFGGGIITGTQEHFVRPIDIMVAFIDWILPYRITFSVGDTKVEKWSLPFQNNFDIFTEAIAELVTEISKKEKKDEEG